jgi:exonuclease VII small subunit
MAEKTDLANPAVAAGIINPDTGQLDFQSSFDRLMGNQFNDVRSTYNQLISDLEQQIADLRGSLKDKKNKQIGEHESKEIGKVKDFDKVTPSGDRGDVAKEKALEDIKDDVANVESSIAELERQIDIYKKERENDLSPTLARIRQGYIIADKKDKWYLYALSADVFLKEKALEVIANMSKQTPVILVVGGKQIQVVPNSDPVTISHIITQYASARSMSAKSFFSKKYSGYII